MANRAERRRRARIAGSAQRHDAQFWRDRNDALVGLLQGIVTQAGGRIIIAAEFTQLRKRSVDIKTDLTSERERIVLTLEPDPPPDPKHGERLDDALEAGEV